MKCTILTKEGLRLSVNGKAIHTQFGWLIVHKTPMYGAHKPVGYSVVDPESGSAVVASAKSVKVAVHEACRLLNWVGMARFVETRAQLVAKYGLCQTITTEVKTNE